jgi:hypothetical protein
LGFYAFALDGEKKKVLTIASNAGYCLWTGIVPRERAGSVVRRLMAPDIFAAAVMQGVAGSALGPGIAAISLGPVGHDALAERLGPNQRFAVQP